MTPRNTLAETRAKGQLRHDFFRAFLLAYLKGGPDYEFGPVRDALAADVCERLLGFVSPDALGTPVVFTDDLPDTIYAGTIQFSDGTTIIALNARMKVDPEYLAHSLVEEIVHAQQILDGTDFAAQRRTAPHALCPSPI